MGYSISGWPEVQGTSGGYSFAGTTREWLWVSNNSCPRFLANLLRVSSASLQQRRRYGVSSLDISSDGTRMIASCLDCKYDSAVLYPDNLAPHTNAFAGFTPSTSCALMTVHFHPLFRFLCDLSTSKPNAVLITTMWHRDPVIRIFIYLRYSFICLDKV